MAIKVPTIPTISAMVLLIFGLITTVSAQPDFESKVELPSARDLSSALSDPSSRSDALLTMVALSKLGQISPAALASQLPLLETEFRDNREWLDRLASRFSRLPARPTLLDPAAWFVQQELSQHAITPSRKVSPLGPGDAELLEQLFDRTDERLAAAFLPEALFNVEFVASSLWVQLLEQSQSNQILQQLLVNLNSDWFELWQAAEPPAPLGSDDMVELLENSLAHLQAMMSSVIFPQAPDDLRVKRVRFGLLNALPTMEPEQASTARHLLILTSAVNGLHDENFLEFIQSLLWVVSDLLEVYGSDPNAWSPIPKLLVDFLPQLSNVMARNFTEVDSRFNANLAATFDVVQELQSGSIDQLALERHRRELANTITQLVLLVPEIEFYFEQPVRQRISAEIDICISVAAVRDESGSSLMSRKQFDGCIESLVNMAQTQARRTELAGDPSGPFASDQLRRELDMAPWQRVNYTLGYLHHRTNVNCPMPTQSLPNPLEWSALATLLVWFADQSPVYFQTPENEALVNRIRQEGLDLVKIMSQQVDCISGASGGLNDLVSVSLQQYRRSLLDLVGGIRETELEFRESRFRPGADVVLAGSVDQETAYRTSGLEIAPCDQTRVCEMTQKLETTRALVGQFPDEYLIADQTGLGNVEICYDNMQWIQRRAERVRTEDPNVANYHGHLSFDIIGQYRERDQVTKVFGSNFVSPDEYHYLIAENLPEVLNDGCPSEWVGKTIVTERTQEEGIHIVPNRLTYLAAARSKPSEVINSNWSRGAEWRDWFVTGIGVENLDFEPGGVIRDQLGQHLKALYDAEQQSIYSSLLRPGSRNSNTAGSSLFELMSEVSMFKGLLRNQLILFYPELMLDSDHVRAALEGQSGLLDSDLLRRFQENNVPISQIHDIGLARLEQFQSEWKALPESVIRSGTVAVSVAHAVARINALYREHFAKETAVTFPLESLPLTTVADEPESAVPEQ